MLLGLFASGSYMLHSRRKVRKYYAFLIDLNETLVARPPADAPLAFLSARCEEFSFSITESRRILPFKCVAAPVEPRTRETGRVPDA